MKRIAIFLLIAASCQQPATQLSNAAPETVAADQPAKHTVKTITLPGKLNLQYVEQGDASGIPVILLHGITDSWHSFEPVLEQLPKNIHAFAISQRGHGDSDRPSQGYTPQDFADDVAAFIREKKLQSAVVVGHSMGGMVAQQFAISYPELTKGLVIIDSDAEFNSNPGMPEFYAQVMKMEGSISYAFMDEFQRATLSRPIDSTWYKTLVTEGTKVPVRVFQAALTGIVQSNLREDLKKVNAPTLILWGDKDAFCTRKGQDIMNNNIRNSSLVIYEGVGHALHWEEPARFVKDLTAFLQGL
ncbi:MAG TPA: alpha/beta hydrolase [Chitinophagaceae bacterium]|nr:alpha/beta hydrolase [Chitinophagaceae bacterium]